MQPVTYYSKKEKKPDDDLDDTGKEEVSYLLFSCDLNNSYRIS